MQEPSFLDIIEHVNEIGNKFKDVEVSLIGSFFVCDPPVTDTDIDILIYAPILLTKSSIFSKSYVNNVYMSVYNHFYLLSDVPKQIENYGAIISGSSYGSRTRQICSMRNGKYNYIITPERKIFDALTTAAQVSRVLNLTNKEDRVKVAKLLAYGEH